MIRARGSGAAGCVLAARLREDTDRQVMLVEAGPDHRDVSLPRDVVDASERRVYDGWAASGSPGWGFADVLDDVRRLECDVDFADEWHGSHGAIPSGGTRR
jgi:choline dehydrogenase-like flavoprotein